MDACIARGTVGVLVARTRGRKRNTTGTGSIANLLRGAPTGVYRKLKLESAARSGKDRKKDKLRQMPPVQKPELQSLLLVHLSPKFPRQTPVEQELAEQVALLLVEGELVQVSPGLAYATHFMLPGGPLHEALEPQSPSLTQVEPTARGGLQVEVWSQPRPGAQENTTAEAALGKKGTNRHGT